MVVWKAANILNCFIMDESTEEVLRAQQKDEEKGEK